MIIVCYSCKSEFDRVAKRGCYCPSCKRAYDNAYNAARAPEKKRQKIDSQADRRRALHKMISEYFLENPCVDCGEVDPVVLEFDHRSSVEKDSEVSNLLKSGASWGRIKAEIDKCDVRCANCHKRRTAVQFGWAMKKRLLHGPEREVLRGS